MLSRRVMLLTPLAVMAANRKPDLPTTRTPALEKETPELKSHAPQETRTTHNRYEQIHAKKSRQNQEERKK